MQPLGNQSTASANELPGIVAWRGTGGREDTKLIYGIIVVGKKVRPEKVAKVNLRSFLHPPYIYNEPRLIIPSVSCDILGMLSPAIVTFIDISLSW